MPWMLRTSLNHVCITSINMMFTTRNNVHDMSKFAYVFH